MVEEIKQNNYCRKCLLKDMPEDAYFKSLYDYIAHIDMEVKAKPEEYQRRLALCQKCDNLLNGMCRVCGCFVELRAVINNNYCPDIHKLW